MGLFPDKGVMRVLSQEVLLVLKTPIKCSECDRMATLFVNRMGHTRCIHCDTKRTKE